MVAVGANIYKLWDPQGVLESMRHDDIDEIGSRLHVSVVHSYVSGEIQGRV